MDGILLVDKPIGWTSHDVVAKVRSVLRKQLPTSHYPLSTRAPKVRVGHAGTLDPLATGLMIILIGAYTKKAAEYSKLDKTYEAVIKLGQTSTTGDSEGKIEPFDSSASGGLAQGKPSQQEVEKVLHGFVGTSLQTPHAYSAVKVGGKRAYKLARASKEFKIEPRTVTIYSVENIEYKYPLLQFTTRVSSGTYIRSLAEDIGQKLGTGAYITALRRTQIGNYSIAEAKNIDELTDKEIQKHLSRP